MKRTIGFIYFCVLFTLSACGSKDETPVATQAAVEQNFRGGDCGREVVGDYRSVQIRCERPFSRDHEHACRREAETFLAKYPGIDCVASLRRGRGSEARTYRIEAREIRELLERLDRNRR